MNSMLKLAKFSSLEFTEDKTKVKPATSNHMIRPHKLKFEMGVRNFIDANLYSPMYKCERKLLQKVYTSASCKYLIECLIEKAPYKLDIIFFIKYIAMVRQDFVCRDPIKLCLKLLEKRPNNIVYEMLYCLTKQKSEKNSFGFTNSCAKLKFSATKKQELMHICKRWIDAFSKDQLMTKSYRPYYLLGKISELDNDKQKALDFYYQANDISPDSTYVKRAIIKLSKASIACKQEHAPKKWSYEDKQSERVSITCKVAKGPEASCLEKFKGLIKTYEDQCEAKFAFDLVKRHGTLSERFGAFWGDWSDMRSNKRFNASFFIKSVLLCSNLDVILKLVKAHLLREFPLQNFTYRFMAICVHSFNYPDHTKSKALKKICSEWKKVKKSRSRFDIAGERFYWLGKAYEYQHNSNYFNGLDKACYLRLANNYYCLSIKASPSYQKPYLARVKLMIGKHKELTFKNLGYVRSIVRLYSSNPCADRVLWMLILSYIHAEKREVLCAKKYLDSAAVKVCKISNEALKKIGLDEAMMIRCLSMRLKYRKWWSSSNMVRLLCSFIPNYVHLPVYVASYASVYTIFKPLEKEIVARNDAGANRGFAHERKKELINGIDVFRESVEIRNKLYFYLPELQLREEICFDYSFQVTKCTKLLFTGVCFCVANNVLYDKLWESMKTLGKFYGMSFLFNLELVALALRLRDEQRRNLVLDNVSRIYRNDPLFDHSAILIGRISSLRSNPDDMQIFTADTIKPWPKPGHIDIVYVFAAFDRMFSTIFFTNLYSKSDIQKFVLIIDDYLSKRNYSASAKYYQDRDNIDISPHWSFVDRTFFSYIDDLSLEGQYNDNNNDVNDSD